MPALEWLLAGVSGSCMLIYSGEGSHRDAVRQRFAEAGVTPDRVEFVLPGCAVFAALVRLWPAPRVTVADRGLREGMLLRMIRADGRRGRG